MSDTRSDAKYGPFWIQDHFPKLVSNSFQLVVWSRMLTNNRYEPDPATGSGLSILYAAEHAARALKPFGVLGTTPADLPAIESIDVLEIKDLERVFLSWSRWAEEAAEVIEHTPVPDAEWSPVLEVIELDSLAELVGVSAASLRRYSTGERATPQEVAERLHTIALIIADLTGSYNEYGIRRWFSRPRKQLGLRAPVDVLTGAWSPDDPDVRSVRDLAGALVSLGAT